MIKTPSEFRIEVNLFNLVKGNYILKKKLPLTTYLMVKQTNKQKTTTTEFCLLRQEKNN